MNAEGPGVEMMEKLQMKVDLGAVEGLRGIWWRRRMKVLA
jgi:hypothetical protein